LIASARYARRPTGFDAESKPRFGSNGLRYDPCIFLDT
jgi:hypothetical protein